MHNYYAPGRGTFDNPALSCDDFASVAPDTLPGYVWLRTTPAKESRVLVKCIPHIPVPEAIPGLMMIADIDMNDPFQHCPEGFRQTTAHNTRVCGRTATTGGCSSVVFPTHSVNYSTVCGRMLAYQHGSPTGFNTPASEIDKPYVDGVSITYGKSPNRRHVWTLSNTIRTSGNPEHVCPCGDPESVSTMHEHIPDFVGNDYFCDSRAPTEEKATGPHDADPLWDGQGCDPGDACCTFNSPPWFCKKLPEITNEDVELRICANEGWETEDTLLNIVELYVQ